MAPPPSPPPCSNDTIWAQPRTPGEAPAGTAVSTYKFTTSPTSLTTLSAPNVYTWQPIQTLMTAETKWGGYFTIPPPPVTSTPTTWTTITPPGATSSPFGCAGCAKNDPRRGYDVGGVVLQVRTISSTSLVATCSMTIKNNANVTVVVDSGHFYSSFAPLPNFNPGQFPSANITGIPGAEGTTVTMTQKVGGTRPSSNPLVYLACHFTVVAC
ncbi:hypothetical protein HYH03_003587 [Edaphochlamys debaryana]|uniref:Uncharacterized protein n=1 Tax=Edaphochlamys debaryana TaxID=47281 RepID=A0A836C421_9CHLO|nr:hypothetical protein HYH03_003587 [Edaphochlamys debaryana]|eukprot:KAG2498327.1 hypothetical protein HYH03_003587 [Edaphochlamys debaryana]